MTDVLNVELRETRGSRNARRLREQGRIPAVLYGHGEETVSIAISAEELEATIGHGAKFVDLKGALSESALQCLCSLILLRLLVKIPVKLLKTIFSFQR